MIVTIDSREKDRKERAEIFYSGKGHETKIEMLEVGDYLFNDQVVFEYKEIGDFMSSITNESLFNEAANQSLKYPYHYVVIVGDMKSFVKENFFKYLTSYLIWEKKLLISITQHLQPKK